MNKNIRFIAYSDIHMYEYTNGLTLQDTIDAECELISLAKEQGCHAIIFGGDRYHSRNATTRTRMAAEASLINVAQTGLPILYLIGNHCRDTKSNHSRHSSENINLYRSTFNNITVLDVVSRHYETINGLSVVFHAIPAGHIIDKLIPDLNVDFNIVLFHDLVKGCKSTSGISLQDGINRNSLDVCGMDIVIGGDNHHHQDLEFNNTTGLFIGSPMQHNWGDSGDKRGYVIIDLLINNGIKQVKYKHIESRAPKFIKYEIRIADINEVLQLALLKKDEWNNNIIKLTIMGPSSSLNNIEVAYLQHKIRDITNARMVKSQLVFDTDNIVNHADVKKMSDEESWINYLDTLISQDEHGQYDKELVKQIGLEIIRGD